MINTLESVACACMAILLIVFTTIGVSAVALYFCEWAEKKFGRKTKKKQDDAAKEHAKARKAIRKMLKNEYGLIPICNRPTETKEKEESAE